MCKKSGFVILSLVTVKRKKTISNDDHFVISPRKMQIGNKFEFERWLCVLQCKALVLAVHSRETRNDSNETRRVSREARCVSREGGNLHLSSTIHCLSSTWSRLPSFGHLNQPLPCVHYTSESTLVGKSSFFSHGPGDFPFPLAHIYIYIYIILSLQSPYKYHANISVPSGRVDNKCTLLFVFPGHTNKIVSFLEK